MKKIVIFFLILAFAIPAYSAKVSIGKNQEIIVDGKPFFPLGVWLQPTKQIDLCKSLGINIFLGHDANGEDAKFYLDTCASKGVYCSMQYVSFNDDQIKAFKEHPAFVYWISADEPDQIDEKKGGPIVSPEEIIEKYKWIKKLDPDHPVSSGFTAFWVMDRPQIKAALYPKYLPGMDISGFDIYPCNLGEPQRLYYYMKGCKKLNKLDKGLKPHSVALEVSFIGAEKGKQKDPKCRAPNANELKAEVWMSIVGGAHEILYFTHSWSPSYSQCRIPEDLQAEMKILNKQITDLAPIILSANSNIEVTAEKKGDSETDVETLVKEGSGKIYIFTSNIKYKAGDVEFTIKGASSGDVEVYEENRKLKMTNGKFTDKFKEYEPHVYIMAK